MSNSTDKFLFMANGGTQLITIADLAPTETHPQPAKLREWAHGRHLKGNSIMFRTSCAALLLSAAGLYAQSSAAAPVTTKSAEPPRSGVTHVDPGHMYYRVYAVVPMIGTGTKDDPKRPMFAPSPAETAARAPGNRSGILAFQYQLSDDKKLGLTEFVAAERAAFQTMLASSDPDVKCFERGKHTKDEIQAEFAKHKKDFQFSEFTARVQ
jgi:hypothetical protein